MSIKRDIYLKINSIENTKKITKAMEMIAASKMYKIQNRISLIKIYSKKVREIVLNLSLSTNKSNSFFLNKNNSKNVGFILITTDKGLCGNINFNSFKKFLSKIKKINNKISNISVTSIGSKGFNFLNRMGYKILSYVNNIGDNPKLEKFIGLIKTITDLYYQNKLGTIYVIYTKFINTIKQKSVLKQILPLSNFNNFSINNINNKLNYICEPNFKKVFDKLIVRYIESLIFKAVIENIASEHSARMITMNSANNNANNLINDLKLIYNKTRQSLITNELSEIISGSIII